MSFWSDRNCSSMSCQEHFVGRGKWKWMSFATNMAEVKLPQVSYLPFTCKSHRHLYAPLLQLFQLVILIFSVSCISSTCSHQHMEGPQAEDLSHRSSVKLLPVWNRENPRPQERKQLHSKGKAILCTEGYELGWWKCDQQINLTQKVRTDAAE